MKLTEWADIAEIIGGAAIIASLIFIGVEVRENTRVTILTSDRSLDQQNLVLNLAIINSADFADILIRAEIDRDSLTATERVRFDNYCLSRFATYENVVANFGEGLIDDEEYDIWATLFKSRYGQPGYRQFWIEYRTVYFAKFRAWADKQYGVSAD